MKNRKLQLIKNIINYLPKDALEFKDDQYWLNLEYDYADWIADCIINNENYSLNDYFLGSKSGDDKYATFENKKELAMHLFDQLCENFNNIWVNINDDIFEIE